jgi:hypothetical protein
MNLKVNFFFKRDKEDRVFTKLFFFIIINRLAQKVPSLNILINEIIVINLSIYNKSLNK